MSLTCLVSRRLIISSNGKRQTLLHVPWSKWRLFSSSSPKETNESVKKNGPTAAKGNNNMKTLGIFAAGVYIGLCIFKDGKGSSDKKQSAIFREMKQEFDKSSGIS